MSNNHISLDLSDIHELGDDLRGMAVDVDGLVRPIIKRAGVEIKREARRRVSHIRHTPHYSQSIDFDLDPDGLGLEAGPNADSPTGEGEGFDQSFLGPILEYGGIHSGPNPHMGPALDLEAVKTEKVIADTLRNAFFTR